MWNIIIKKSLLKPLLALTVVWRGVFTPEMRLRCTIRVTHVPELCDQQSHESGIRTRMFNFNKSFNSTRSHWWCVFTHLRSRAEFHLPNPSLVPPKVPRSCSVLAAPKSHFREIQQIRVICWERSFFPVFLVPGSIFSGPSLTSIRPRIQHWFMSRDIWLYPQHKFSAAWNIIIYFFLQWWRKNVQVFSPIGIKICLYTESQ